MTNLLRTVSPLFSPRGEKSGLDHFEADPRGRALLQ